MEQNPNLAPAQYDQPEVDDWDNAPIRGQNDDKEGVYYDEHGNAYYDDDEYENEDENYDEIYDDEFEEESYYEEEELEEDEYAQRMRDFHFAQQKRRQDGGAKQRPMGIHGLYEYLNGIRADVEWAEDAAYRRKHGEPYLAWQDFDNHKDDGFNAPICIYMLLFICLIMIPVTVIYNGGFEAMTVNPMIGPNSATLIHFGAKRTKEVVDDHQVWRLVIHAFLHAGIIHYLVNLVALWFVGRAVESAHGFVKTFLIFWISAIGACILSAIFLPQFISVGASGGMFGLIGAALADIYHNWDILFDERVVSVPQKKLHKTIVIWLWFDVAVNLLIGITPWVDNWIHLGGILYGFCVGLSIMEHVSTAFFGIQKKKWEVTKLKILRILGLVIAILGLIISFLYLMFGNLRDECKWCGYITCVPLPWWTDNKWWYCDDCAAATASIRFVPNSTTQFGELDLNCPDEPHIDNITIAHLNITDINVVQDLIPKYCRSMCEDIYI